MTLCEWCWNVPFTYHPKLGYSKGLFSPQWKLGATKITSILLVWNSRSTPTYLWWLIKKQFNSLFTTSIFSVLTQQWSPWHLTPSRPSLRDQSSKVILRSIINWNQINIYSQDLRWTDHQHEYIYLQCRNTQYVITKKIILNNYCKPLISESGKGNRLGPLP